MHLLPCLFQNFGQNFQPVCCFASLTKEQKGKLADGPDLEDFITGEAKPGIEYKGNLKRKKGER